MRIAIYGAGAIGGYLGVRLALAGFEVTLIARGAHLAAMQQYGVRLLTATGEWTAHPVCTADPHQVGVHDAVILTLKTHALPTIVADLPALLGPHTLIVTAMNGLPWWYFQGLDHPLRDYVIQAVDPGGILTRHIALERIIGCVVYPACEVVAPGVIRHLSGDRFTLGEPSGEQTERIQRLSQVLIQAGCKAPIRTAIRDEIWLKLWGNLCFNPLSILTQAPLDTIATDPKTQAICRTMMQEAQAVAERLGVRFPITIAQRIAGAAQVGAHKTSMRQDIEQGRRVELDALLTAVCEVADQVGVATPTLDLILALAQQRARMAGCY